MALSSMYAYVNASKGGLLLGTSTISTVTLLEALAILCRKNMSIPFLVVNELQDKMQQRLQKYIRT